MFEDLDLFIIVFICMAGVLGLNLLMNYPYVKYRLQRNIKFSNPFFIRVKKRTMKWILIIDLILFIIATISMVFDSRLFILLFIIIYLITIFPAMGRLLIKARKEAINVKKEVYNKPKKEEKMTEEGNRISEGIILERASIRISRPRANPFTDTEFSIVLDDNKIGNIANGDKAKFVVIPGDHRILYRFKYRNYGTLESNEVHFSISEGEKLHFKISNNLDEGLRVLYGMSLPFHSARYLKIRLVDGDDKSK